LRVAFGNGTWDLREVQVIEILCLYVGTYLFWKNRFFKKREHIFFKKRKSISSCYIEILNLILQFYPFFATEDCLLWVSFEKRDLVFEGPRNHMRFHVCVCVCENEVLGLFCERVLFFVGPSWKRNLVFERGTNHRDSMFVCVILSFKKNRIYIVILH